MDRMDKLVITAGILVLVISAAGIVYHEQTYEVSEEIKETSYRITWNEYSDEIMENGEVNRNEEWKNAYPIKLDGNAVISNIEITVEWSDDRDFQGLLLPWNWSDTIDMNVEISEMQFSQSASGFKVITMSATDETPRDIIVDDVSDEELGDILRNEAKNHANCKISLSISPKPRFLDNGNEFTLHIAYHYYMPDIQAM